MGIFDIFRTPPYRIKVDRPVDKLKLCKDCKHNRGRRCYNPNFNLLVDVVEGSVEGEWCSFLRSEYGSCKSGALGREPRV